MNQSEAKLATLKERLERIKQIDKSLQLTAQELKRRRKMLAENFLMLTKDRSHLILRSHQDRQQSLELQKAPPRNMFSLNTEIYKKALFDQKQLPSVANRQMFEDNFQDKELTQSHSEKQPTSVKGNQVDKRYIIGPLLQLYPGLRKKYEEMIAAQQLHAESKNNPQKKQATDSTQTKAPNLLDIKSKEKQEKASDLTDKGLPQWKGTQKTETNSAEYEEKKKLLSFMPFYREPKQKNTQPIFKTEKLAYPFFKIEQLKVCQDKQNPSEPTQKKIAEDEDTPIVIPPGDRSQPPNQTRSIIVSEAVDLFQPPNSLDYQFETKDAESEEDKGTILAEKRVNLEISPVQSDQIPKTVIFKEQISKFRKGKGPILKNLTLSLQRCAEDPRAYLLVRLPTQTAIFSAVIQPKTTGIRAVKQSSKNIEITNILECSHKTPTPELVSICVQFPELKNAVQLKDSLEKLVHEHLCD